MTDKDIDPENVKTHTQLAATIDRLVAELEIAVGEETPTDLEKRVRVLTGCFKLQDILNEKAKSQVQATPEPTCFLNMIPPNDEEIASMRTELIRRYDRLAGETAKAQIDK